MATSPPARGPDPSRRPLHPGATALRGTAPGSTDIVMLLTPRIVRTHGLTQEDVGPIHIGTRDNPGG